MLELDFYYYYNEKLSPFQLNYMVHLLRYATFGTGNILKIQQVVV